MISTKNLFLAGAFCLSALGATAQENVVKLDLVSLGAISQLNLNYERMLDPRKSINVQVGWGWGSDLTSTFQSTFDANNTSTSNTSNIRLSKAQYNGGFQIAPEMRFYLSDQEGPRGFYLGPQLNFSSYSATLTGSHNYTNSSGSTALSNDKVVLNYTAIGGGLQLGAQWIINDHISIDWGFLGLGFVSSTVSATGTTDDLGQLDKWAADAKSAVDNKNNGGGAGSFLGFVKSNDKITAAGTTLLPSLRSTLCVGYAF